MRRHLPSLLFCIAALLMLAPMARALGPKGDAFFGYSRTATDTFTAGVGGLNGWEAAAQIHLHPFLGAEGDVAHYGLWADASIPRTTTFLFGPRVTVGAVGVHLFAHALVGGEHTDNSGGAIAGTSLAWALGGGIDFPIAPFFAWRVNGDYITSPTSSPSSGTPARFGTGLVLRF